MEDIYNASAIEASQAMTRLMGRGIQVSFPDTSEAPIGEISEMLGGEEAAVARIYVGIQGDIKGGCLFVMAYEEAFRLCDILLQREAGTTRALGEEENSALSETGNILCSSFINAVADGSGLTALSEVPDLCVDMCQAAIDPVLARFNQSGMTLLVTRTELFVDESERSVSNMLLFLDQGSYPALSAAFAARDSEPQGRR
jgi:chemotaxis protein CheC